MCEVVHLCKQEYDFACDSVGVRRRAYGARAACDNGVWHGSLVYEVCAYKLEGLRNGSPNPTRFICLAWPDAPRRAARERFSCELDTWHHSQPRASAAQHPKPPPWLTAFAAVRPPATLLPRARPRTAPGQPESAPPCLYLHMTDVPPGRPMGAGAAGPDPRAAAAANGLMRGGPGLRGRPRGKRGRGGGRCGGGRGARSSGGAGRRRWFGAGLARSARTYTRWSFCLPGAGGRPGAELRAQGPERRGSSASSRGVRGQSRYPPELRGREGASEQASQPASGEGRGLPPRTRAAPRPAPPACPARRTPRGRREKEGAAPMAPVPSAP